MTQQEFETCQNCGALITQDNAVKVTNEGHLCANCCEVMRNETEEEK